MLRLFGERGSMRETDRAYMSEAIGWNYKLPEVCSALARVKLRHLDDFIATIQRNAQHLTQRLDGIEGVMPPQVPLGRTHTYYLYPVQIDPEALNLKAEARLVRDAAMWALGAENVQLFLWQKVPVPAQPLFQDKLAYGRGCPWKCHGGGDVSYDLSQYPNTRAILDSSFVMRGFIPPNGIELMDAYAAAFEKAFARIDRVVKLYQESHG
jgi:dTDP-4-amino-4,6-dideoxygalactose transaminase